MTPAEDKEWPSRGLRMEIWERDLPAFFACLCLGMLHAIREGTIPAEVGIWALGPPWADRLKGRVPGGVRGVLYETDEIEVGDHRVGHEDVNARLDKMISRLNQELRRMPDTRWTMHPVSAEGTTSPWPVDLSDMTDDDGDEPEDWDDNEGPDGR